jgi:TM2 domain-containing membrane protein YozV
MTDTFGVRGMNMADKTVFGILAILLGAYGIHKFYIGQTKWGIVYLAITLCTLGGAGIVMWIIALIAGIKALKGTEEEFQAYIDSESFM